MKKLFSITTVTDSLFRGKNSNMADVRLLMWHVKITDNTNIPDELLLEYRDDIADAMNSKFINAEFTCGNEDIEKFASENTEKRVENFKKFVLLEGVNYEN